MLNLKYLAEPLRILAFSKYSVTIILMNLVELASLNSGEVPLHTHPIYDQLPTLQKINASLAASKLVLCGTMGLYNPDSPKRLVDFGAGKGGSTFALALLAEQNAGSVDAVEDNPARASHLEATGLEAQMPVRLHRAEGIRWLYDHARGGESFDLINAAMFGPDFEGDLARKLLLVSRSALKSGGSMIIYSDPLTMAATQEVCEEEGVDFQGIGQLTTGLSGSPDTIVVTNP